ncbi:hypothetical protein ACLOJK_004332 [Asimina triloba]
MGENQEMKDFYVEKGSSCGRRVPKKPLKEGFSAMFESSLIAGLQSAFSVLRERISLRRALAYNLLRRIGLLRVLSHRASLEGDPAPLRRKRSRSSLRGIDRHDEGSVRPPALLA